MGRVELRNKAFTVSNIFNKLPGRRGISLLMDKVLELSRGVELRVEDLFDPVLFFSINKVRQGFGKEGLGRQKIR